jgi:hypothetical protein
MPPSLHRCSHVYAHHYTSPTTVIDLPGLELAARSPVWGNYFEMEGYEPPSRRVVIPSPVIRERLSGCEASWDVVLSSTYRGHILAYVV